MPNSFARALQQEMPLQIPGVINAYAAMTARRLGFGALYISGSATATASYGLPDLGVTSREDVLVDLRRISSAVPDLPIMVDCDTGWGSALSIARTVREMQRSGAAAIHLEDQVASKRCGHLAGKQLVGTSEMCDRLAIAKSAAAGPDFMLVARADALAVEGIEKTLARVRAYVEAGADAIFAEAVTDIGQYRAFADAAQVPILANMTEFGKTPLWHIDELAEAGVSLVIYPLSAFRAMARAAESVFRAIRESGSQRPAIDSMEPRDALYDNIGYHDAQAEVDRILDAR